MPQYVVTLNDGRKVRVTAASPQDADRAAGEYLRAKPAKGGAMREVTGAAANLNRGLAIGDELAAAGGVVSGLLTGRHRFGADKPGNVLANNLNMLGEAYRRELAWQRAREDDFAARRPNMAALARGTGNALTLVAPIGPGAQAFAQGTRAQNALLGATTAAATGAGYAAADRGTARERLAAASDLANMGVNALLGAGAGAMARGRPKSQPKRVRPPAPSLEELQTQRTAAYQAVEKSGHTFSPDEISILARNIVDDMGKARINPARQPKAASMLEEISTIADDGPMTLSQLDELRQIVRRDVASTADQSDARLGRRMIAQIDAFIDKAGGAGAPQIRRARDLNTRVRKLEVLEGLDEAATDRTFATGVGSNSDNVLRQNVIRFKDRVPNLTPAERAAADRVIRATPGQNLLRQVGRLSPEGGAVPAGVSIVTGAASGGAIPAVGFVSRRVADAMTRRNVQALRDIIARGGEEAAQVVKVLEDPAYAELRRQVASDLAVQAGVQGSSARGAVSYGPR